MEALISAVVGDLVGRAISFVVEKFREQRTAEEDLQRLHQLLLRLRAIVEEAEGRRVMNRGMICQVSMMTKQMFRGYYLLDTYKCREKKTNEEEVSRSLFVQSKFNPAKRFRRLSSDTQIESIDIGKDISKELKQVLLVLESMAADLKEFVIFLMSYPRMYRQPYGAYLFLDKCMFGRQMEREQAISFLLQADHLGGGNVGVLPIVGPRFIGKSTLVEHVCDDERVRNHFSMILLYSGNDLKDETAMTFRDHCVIKHQNIVSGNERSLVVIELVGDVDEGAWKRLLHSSERCMTCGSKIIVTSRSEQMVRFGTTEAIKLTCLSKEAFWYFFKMLVFGSTDPEEHPKLTSIAMEAALEMRGSFIFAYIVAALLRENLSVQFWCRVLRNNHYWNFRIRWVPESSPRAKARALGKLTYAESTSRQQAYLGKHNILPRVVLGKKGRLGKGTLCREPSSRRTAKCYHVAHPAANDGTVTVALLYREPFSAKLRLYLHSY